MSEDYYQKYMKYKLKYMELKGGSNIPFRDGKLDIKLFDCNLMLGVNRTHDTDMITNKDMIIKKYAKLDEMFAILDNLNRKRIEDLEQLIAVPLSIKKDPYTFFSNNILRLWKKFDVDDMTFELKEYIEPRILEESIIKSSEGLVSIEFNNSILNLTKFVSNLKKVNENKEDRYISNDEYGKFLSLIPEEVKILITPVKETKVNNMILSPDNVYILSFVKDGDKYNARYDLFREENVIIAEIIFTEKMIGKNIINLLYSDLYRIYEDYERRGKSEKYKLSKSIGYRTVVNRYILKLYEKYPEIEQAEKEVREEKERDRRKQKYRI